MAQCRLFLACTVVATLCTLSAFGGGERIDDRIRGAVLDSKLTPSRLSLPPVRDKDSNKELEVKKKKKTSRGPAVRRVTKEDNQRKRKTKRVVGSQ